MNRLFWIILVCLQELIMERYILCYSHTPIQYHIQTDRGPNRYFRFQTMNGQYRKEKRFEDGTVVGTYGWVDPSGLLRLYDYIAGKEGYRVARKRTFKTKLASEDNKDSTEFQRAPITQTGSSYNPRVSVQTNRHVSYGTTPQPLAPSESNSLEISEPNTDSIIQHINKPRLRPLFVRKRRPSNQNSRRRQNFVSSRKRFQQQTKHLHNTNSSPLRTASLRTPQPLRAKHTAPSNAGTRTVRIKSVSPSKFTSESLPNYGFDEPGGKITINFDLGIQYRKEKRFPDGKVVGEHGYVDPMGILRVTRYTSGPGGIREARKSHWVGTRTPGL